MVLREGLGRELEQKRPVSGGVHTGWAPIRGVAEGDAVVMEVRTGVGTAVVMRCVCVCVWTGHPGIGREGEYAMQYARFAHLAMRCSAALPFGSVNILRRRSLCFPSASGDCRLSIFWANS